MGLKGIRPGKPPSGDNIKNSEILPENYTVFRNDRGTKGCGVFIAVQANLTAIESVDFITDCEIEIAKITLNSKPEDQLSCKRSPDILAY